MTSIPASVQQAIVPAAPKSTSSGCAVMESTRATSASSSTSAILAARRRSGLVGNQGRGRPGQGLLPEEGGRSHPHEEEPEQSDDRSAEGDQEDPTDVPLQAGHRPEGVAAAGGIFLDRKRTRLD